MLNKLEKKLGKGRVGQDVNLFFHMTLRTYTKAKFFFEAKTREDLISAKRATLALDIPLYVIGGGSNIFFTKDCAGLVVKNMYQKKEVLNEDSSHVELLVSSGYSVSRLVNETVSAGLEGFEYHLGLPGTVGGAIYMNSKWTRPTLYFGDSLLYAYLVDQKGKEKKVNRDYFQFAYDTSILQKTREIVLEAVFKLKKTDSEALKKRSQEALSYRKNTQPFGAYSSGCFFRNISAAEQKKLNLPTTSAGYLIDKAGLKGLQVGDFVISQKHANFIVNKGNGKPEDLVRLLDVISGRVKEKFGIDLKKEVVLV